MQPCPLGYFCPKGSSSGIANPCPKGKFGGRMELKNESECTPCTPGFYCDRKGLKKASGPCAAGYFCKELAMSSHPQEGSNANVCPMGFYCHSKTIEPVPCSPGTYGNSFGLTNATGCIPCDAGMYCNESGLTKPTDMCDAGWFCQLGSSTPRQALCSAGSHCPVGTEKEIPCPIGTFSSQKGLKASTECQKCLAGYYCDQPGLINPVATCPPGYFCPEGTSSSTTNACPVAHFCPGNTSSPLLCQEGKFTSRNFSTQCESCPEGFYCHKGMIIDVCPEGHWCPLGSGLKSIRKCPRGTFNNGTGLSQKHQCLVCLPGYYCENEGLTEPQGLCAPGFFCKCGSKQKEPSGLCFNNSSNLPNEGDCATDAIAGPCPKGYYCPEGTSIPKTCTGGSFSNQSGLAECVKCPAGFYCPKLSENIPCPQGYFCPEGTGPNYFKNKCPKGTYGDMVRAQNIDECKKCPAGYYCDTQGSTSTSGKCEAGYYCKEGSKSHRPKDGLCPVGTYCEEGSSEPTGCSPGFFCERAGLDKPSGSCSSGFFCLGNSSTSRPVESDEGSYCPMGAYCPSGSSFPIKCPPGTYLNITHGHNISDCNTCPPGYFCQDYGMDNSLDPCPEGYFCLAGSIDGKENECPKGYYCPFGSSFPILCASGSFQDRQRQSSCKKCPAGSFCNNRNGSIESPSGLCPVGYYCPNGTKHEFEYACPKGSYNDGIGKIDISGCKSCPKGHFCPHDGVSKPMMCNAGYFCDGASITGQEKLCPEGHFCSDGTLDPVPCPVGTYGNVTGLKSKSECISCPSGFFCPSEGIVVPTLPCDAGFFCNNGSTNSQQTSCPKGFYCPRGTTFPLPCPGGTYSDTPGLALLSQCRACQAGMYCNQTGLTEPSGVCESGFFCPSDAKVNVPNPAAFKCPIGFHCPAGASAPKPCLPGFFTNFTHSSECIICPDGYFCVPIDSSANQTTGYFLCPKGFYCPIGTGADMSKCPPGTWSNVMGLHGASGCKKCPAGHYCYGGQHPSGLCSEGHFCTSGVNMNNPDSKINIGIGGICPEGTFCGNGSEIPTSCPEGTFNSDIGKSSCQLCLAGFYCPLGSTNASDFICPKGHFCPPGTQFGSQHKCPPGTFGNRTGLQEENHCSKCTPGSFCSTFGLEEPDGKCQGGFYCELGAMKGQPMNMTEGGGICTTGYYCPTGSDRPIPCKKGHYCNREGLDQPSGMCDAGWFCKGGARNNQPKGIGGDICPPGFYCQEGTSSPTPCPNGFYLPFPGAWNKSSCQPCKLGYYCNGTGLTDVTGECPSQYYCPEGTTSPEKLCPEGYYCPEAVGDPILCPSGQYQPNKGQSTCLICPPGYYCEQGYGPLTNLTLYQCPKGHYCLKGTKSKFEFKCPPGTYNDQLGLKTVESCTDCLGGYYCPSPGLELGTNYSCPAGYYCQKNANSSMPDNDPAAGLCPTGHFCEENTIKPEPCPHGTFNGLTGMMNKSFCEKCIPGSYCNESGLSQPTGFCHRGFYCPSGSISPMEENCPAGSFCPEGSPLPINCPKGTYSNSTNLGNSQDCTNCAPGSYCSSAGGVKPTALCWPGYFCPEGTDTPSLVCTKGFHCPSGSSRPISCKEGFYTGSAQQQSCALCPSGSYCLPINDSYALVGGEGTYECPKGHYCPNGTGSYWPKCPKGTYNPVVSLAMEGECLKCPGGKYCDEYGLTQPAGDCDPGYFCELGNDRPNPSQVNCNISAIGDLCWAGHMCPKGTEKPVECPAGTYQNSTGQYHCQPCPKGFYCPTMTSSLANQQCPEGHYCLENTTRMDQYRCPAGTYNPHKKMRSAQDCIKCPGGMFCHTGVATPSGNISGGFHCKEGCKGPVYSSDDNVEECPIGNYCPTGRSIADCIFFIFLFTLHNGAC